MSHETNYGFTWATDCQPMLDRGKENFKAGRFEWIPVKQGVALYFLEVVPPHDHNGSSFVTGEPYDSDAHGHNVYLCFRGVSTLGIREDPVNDVVAVLRAIPDPDKPAFACYMNRRQFREALRQPFTAKATV